MVIKRKPTTFKRPPMSVYIVDLTSGEYLEFDAPC